MNMIKADKENNIFGALKLIEQLYLDGEIPGYLQLFDPQESLQVGRLECERVDMK